MSPTSPFAKRTYRFVTSSFTTPSSPDRRVTMAGSTSRFGSVVPRSVRGWKRGLVGVVMRDLGSSYSASAAPMMRRWISLVPS